MALSLVVGVASSKAVNNSETARKLGTASYWVSIVGIALTLIAMIIIVIIVATPTSNVNQQLSTTSLEPAASNRAAQVSVGGTDYNMTTTSAGSGKSVSTTTTIRRIG
jgi:hypothetical protein